MDNRRNEPNLKLINMEQVEIEKIDWLLYPFILFGKVTIVQGDLGEGKTTMVLQIIVKLTSYTFQFRSVHRKYNCCMSHIRHLPQDIWDRIHKFV